MKKKNTPKIFLGSVMVIIMILFLYLKVFDADNNKDVYVGNWVIESEENKNDGKLVFSISKENGKYIRVSKSWKNDPDEGYYDVKQKLLIIDNVTPEGRDIDRDYAYKYDDKNDTLIAYNYSITKNLIKDTKPSVYVRYKGVF